MPKLWSETIESHRREVHDAILDTAAALAAEYGLLSVTMSQIAEKTGIGRATLYKYFPDVETIVRAWHQRQVADHLARLVVARDRAVGDENRLVAVLETYGSIQRHRVKAHRHQPHGTELAAFVHRDPQIAQAERKVQQLIRELIDEAAAAGAVRNDVDAGELADYCVGALSAASRLTSQQAVQRLVAVIMSGLRPLEGSDERMSS
ncbi:TetR/AcrR family transcriptional regulator [Jiangella anatolica]|uniref:TetR/AcrR family transcriptional regulator n=1 Tax=Jiangella anatolica TaxID=2670374 RepID=A0A2W2CD56_9ACTN|nr:TetR/AcrR family transcriptional regulator [Jiangella anatolica]PZF86159.1 TetR/AcrR family transcriptional regulator [Jiangella anatolica]